MKTITLLLLATLPLAAFAQTSIEAVADGLAAAAAVAPELHDMSFAGIFKAGGALMYPIALLSIVALAFVIYFAIVIRREQLIPARFVTGLQSMLREGKLSEARASCHVNTSAIAAVMEGAIDYATRHGGKTESGLLREIVQGEGTRQATLLQNQTTYLNDIGVLAPMLGLLGTVWGMLQAFNVVALDMARAKPLDLAGGISLAMITTVAGLIVAIPSMGAYFFFRNRAARLIADLEVTSARLLQEIEIRQHRED